jgi:hypothetical protein
MVGGLFPWTCAAGLLGVAVASMASGCGSSSSQPPPDRKAALAKLKEEDLYKVIGTGKDARKEPISLREKAKLLHEMDKKSQ